MPQVDPSQHSTHAWLKIALAVLAIIILMTVVAAFYVNGRSPFPTAAQVASQADANNAQGSYASSYGALKNAYARAITNQDKLLILPRLAMAAQESNDPTAAVAYYQQLDQLEPHNSTTLLNLAQVANEAGNQQAEVYAEQGALALLQKQPANPGTQAQIDGLKSRLAELSK